MITVKVVFDTGDHFYSRLNCTFEEARSYYLGNVFNLGTVYDNMQTCTDCILMAD